MIQLAVPLVAMLLNPADAGPSEGSYERAVDLVEGLYLYPDEIDAHAMLRSAAEALSDELHWLVVEPQGHAVNLRHGDGTLIGSVSVANIDTLPAALSALENLVTHAGYELDPELDLRLILLQGTTRSLDRFSRVLSGDGLDRFDVRLYGTMVGVGIRFSIRDVRDLGTADGEEGEAIVVTSVTPNGPADRAGMQVDDRIVRIDGRSTVNMPTREVSRKLRGERGSVVKVTVTRAVPTVASEGGAAGDTELDARREVTLRITRDEIVVPNVEHRVLSGRDGEGDVGLVRITHMSHRTVDNLLEALDALEEQGALDNGLILDLRGNTGGSMKLSARAADEFVDHGMLLRTVGHDGGRVRNLEARMDAEVGGAALDLPVVVLMDERTASGAEILAGSLLELQRVAAVGTRSYGKGAVQKIYPLVDDASLKLKLTVAQYVLANDRRITDQGIVPDVVIGEISLDSYGVRYDGWDVERVRTPRTEIIPWVREGFSWRNEDVPYVNLTEEIARRALLDARAPDREPLVASLKRHAAELSDQEWAHLDQAFAARGIDWTPAEEPATHLPPVSVTVRAEPDPSRTDVLRVVAELENRGEVPLYRAAVELTSDFSGWDGLVLPIGRVDPGARVSGEVFVGLHIGVNPREDRVTAYVRAHGVEPTRVSETALKASSTVEPRLEGTVRLVRGEEGEGDRALVTLTNRSELDLDGLEVHFGYPGDLDVELLDRASRTPLLAGKASHTFELGVQVGDDAPASLPMRLVIESSRYGKLETWPLDLPLDGDTVVLQPPVVAPLEHPAWSTTGAFSMPLRVTDDNAVDHVVVYRNGEKVAWAAGGERTVELVAEMELEEGVNRVLVLTEDDQGLTDREQYVVRGVPGDAAVDGTFETRDEADEREGARSPRSNDR